MKFLKRVLRCGRRRRSRAVHVLDSDSQEQEEEYGFQQPRRRTYYYSMFAARLAIMVMLAVLIALLTILTWHFTTVYTTKSIKNLAFSLRTELLNRPIARMSNLLNATAASTLTQVQLSKFALGQYSLPMDAAAQAKVHNILRNSTWALFANIQYVKNILVYYKNGQLQSFDRTTGSNATYYYYSDPTNATTLTGVNFNDSSLAPELAPVSSWPDTPAGTGTSVWYLELVDNETGAPISNPVATQTYDLSKETNPVFLFKDGDVEWHVTLSKYESTPLLSSAAAIYYPGTNDVMAVTGITTALASINTFLRELTVAHSGYLYLCTANGYLLATSTNATLINVSGSTRSLIRANESDDPIVRAGAQWLLKNYGDGLLTQAVHAEDVRLEGSRYFIDTFSLEYPNLQMVGVILIPRSYVMGEVDRRGRTTLAILIAVSVCILVVGCVLILILTSGVSTEMKLRAELIDHLDARRRAEASSNYKSQFLANMSHELRTPMAAVIGLLDILLCDDCLSAEHINMVAQIRRCSTALLRLLNNILDISKVESGKLLLEEADFDLSRELEGLVDMFSVQCVEHDIEVVLDLSDDMPRMVKGDSARTVQIFANLIANSLKFTSSGHVILRGWCGSIDAPASALRNGLLYGTEASSKFQKLRHGPGGPSVSEPGKLLLWFEVEDTGCGIDPSKWETVFDSFVQADPSTTRTYGGTGLGLCIVRSLVRKMGGDIKVAKKEGSGTLIRFYLVFGQPSESEPDTPRLNVPSELNDAKILLAMKGEIARGTLAQWMQYRGLQVYEASDWDETLQVLQGLLEEEPMSDWKVGSGQNGYSGSHIAANHLHRDKHLDQSVPDDELSLVLSRSPGHWNLRDTKVYVVLDAELLPWEGSFQVESMLTALNVCRDQGVMISWLLNHDTPSILKTQLRRTGYTITANQPLYKSKLLQLLTSMVGYMKGEVSKMSEFQLQTESDEPKPGYSKVSPAAAIHIPELEKFHSEVHSKLGLSGGQKSMSKVLENWSSARDLVNVSDKMTLEMNQLNHTRDSQPGFLGFSASANSQRLDGSQVFDSEPITPNSERRYVQQADERHEVRNLRLSPSPGTSGDASPRSLSGWLTPTSTGAADQPSVITSSRNPEENVSLNHLIDIPLALPDQVKSSARGGNAVQGGSRHSENDLEAGLLLGVRSGAGVDTWGSLQSPKSGVDSRASNIDPFSAPTPVEVQGEQRQLDSVSVDLAESTEKRLTTQISVQNAVQIPQEVRTSARTPAAKKSPSNGLGFNKALIGVHILLVEDTPVLQKVATIMLEKMGARVVAVGDGLQAVEAIERSRGNTNVARSDGDTGPATKPRNGAVEEFDLVLMDCQMPRMDGYDATRAIRKGEEGSDCHIPIVALTAHAMSSDEAKCLEVGMDAYLTKPIDCKLLVSTILSLTKKGS